MGVSTATSRDLRQREIHRRGLWLGLIVTGGAGFSLFFACATPFAALAALAALKMERRDGLAVVGLVWLANQAVGYGILGYPWTWGSLAWGVAIGLSSLLACLAAAALASARPVRLAVSLPFVAAFTTYELGLYVAGFVLPGEAGAFAFVVVRQIFMVNLVALVGLLAMSRLARAVGHSAHRVPSRELASLAR